jgi:hypothetical protein
MYFRKKHVARGATSDSSVNASEQQNENNATSDPELWLSKKPKLFHYTPSRRLQERRYSSYSFLTSAL